MKKNIFIFCISLCTFSFANDSIPMKKNFIGVDINYFEFSFITFLSGNFNLKYTRTIHKKLDISGSLGMVLPYFDLKADGDIAGIGLIGKSSIVPYYTPVRRNNKVFQIGLGYVNEFQKNSFFINGFTVQLNFLKQSKKSNFCYGVNFYNDLLFYDKLPFYTIGTGFFIGGCF